MAERCGWRLKSVVSLAALSVGVVAAHPVQAQEAQTASAGAQGARWLDSVITLTFEPTMNAFGEAAFDGLVMAVSAWQQVPAELPTMVVERGDSHDVGYQPKTANYNTVRYAADGDPMAKGALAITIITFDTDARRILDADIVMNGEHHFGIFASREDFDEHTYDMQNVLTHELGHLLGLGEDFDNEDATMYAYSLPRETTKRDLDGPDVDSISGLYSEAPPDQASVVGCGGATVSRSGAPGSAWAWIAVGFSLAVWVARRRAYRNAAALALTSILASLTGAADSSLDQHPALLERSVAALTPAPVEASEQSPAETLAATVLKSESRWEQGLIVTRLELDGPACAGEAEFCAEDELEVLGGRVGHLEQIVGHALPPQVGSRVALSQSAGESAPLVRTPDGQILRLRVTAKENRATAE